MENRVDGEERAAGHGHGHGGGGHHGHANDRGLAAIRRYVKQTPRLWRSPLNDAVVSRLAPTPGERAIDIGAGMGAGVMAAASTGARITAIEPTPFLRRVLRLRRLLSRSRSRITVLDAAAEHLSIPDRSIDVAWAVNAMHHWVDPAAAAAELARVLRPGGRILLIDEDFTDPEHPDAARRAAQGHGPQRHGFSPVEAETMGRLLSGAGLVEVDAGKGQLAGRPGLIVTARSPV
jgi:SAM-dependent methyltransferase